MPNLSPGTTWQQTYDTFVEIARSDNATVAAEARRALLDLEQIPHGGNTEMRLEEEILVLFRRKYHDLLQFLA